MLTVIINNTDINIKILIVMLIDFNTISINSDY